MNQDNKKQIVTFIGGTGASAMGGAAKEVADWEVRFIAPVVDDGGGNGRLRKQLGIPPVADLRKALVSLSTLPPEISDAFEYRFQKGDLAEHMMGNVFLAGLYLKFGDINRTTEEAGKLLKCRGRVFASTLEKVTLNTEFENGTILKGENNLDENRDASLGRPKRYFFSKEQPGNPLAVKTIQESSLVVLGPGDLGANTMAPILPAEIKQALQQAKAKLVYVGNLMTKYGETHTLSINDCISFIEDYLERKFDAVLVNNAPIPDEVLALYQQENEQPMDYAREELEKDGRHVIEADLIENKIHFKSKADKLRRSALRHDGAKVVEQLKEIDR